MSKFIKLGEEFVNINFVKKIIHEVPEKNDNVKYIEHFRIVIANTEAFNCSLDRTYHFDKNTQEFKDIKSLIDPSSIKKSIKKKSIKELSNK